MTDATYDAVRQHFTEKEIVEIAWVNAAENYFNLQARPLGIGSDHLLELVTTSRSGTPSTKS